MARRLLRVGLTGGIASGKSHVLKRLEAAGFATIDLDEVAHAVLSRDGAGYAPVVEAFGESILDESGAIDRKALGAIVFASPAQRARLDAIVHPLVRAREVAIARAAEDAGARVFITDAALLVEAGMHLRFDRLVVVWCAPEVQLARLRARDAIEEAAARARLAAQMPADEKRRYADHVVDTSGTVEETNGQVDALAARLRDLAPPPPLALPAGRALAALQNGPAAGPRGLSPERLLAEFADARGFDVGRLARAMVPAAEGPWYRAARPGQQGPGPESLAAALAVCCAARGADEVFVLAAAATVGRLTHTEPAAVAGGALAALAAWAVAREGTVAVLEGPALERWSAEARGRAGAGPQAAVAEELRRAKVSPAPGTLAGALEGLAKGGTDARADAALARTVARLFGA